MNFRQLGPLPEQLLALAVQHDHGQLLHVAGLDDVPHGAILLQEGPRGTRSISFWLFIFFILENETLTRWFFFGIGSFGVGIISKG